MSIIHYSIVHQKIRFPRKIHSSKISVLSRFLSVCDFGSKRHVTSIAFYNYDIMWFLDPNAFGAEIMDRKNAAAMLNMWCEWRLSNLLSDKDSERWRSSSFPLYFLHWLMISQKVFLISSFNLKKNLVKFWFKISFTL